MRFGTREIVLFVMVLALPVVAYFFAFAPQSKEISKQQLEVAHKREMLEKLSAETARNDDLLAANETIAMRVSEIEERLPTGKEIDAIVRQVSDLATESGLKSPSMKSGKPVAAARYREQPLDLTTAGSFRGFYDFLVALERMPRITRITDMTVQRGEDDAEIVVTFTLSIYFRDEEGGAA